MLLKRPTEAGSNAISRWDSTNRVTVEILNSYWEKVSAALPMPGTMAGDGASYGEWVEGNYKYFGMRRADGAKHGVIRCVTSTGWILEQTCFEDKKPGLCFVWYCDSMITTAFQAIIFEHGEQKAYINWKSDWSEHYSSGNKALLTDFK